MIIYVSQGPLGSGPEPIQHVLFEAVVSSCPTLSFWRKAGVQIQLFFDKVHFDNISCHLWGPERCQPLCKTYIPDSPNRQLLAPTRQASISSQARPKPPKPGAMYSATSDLGIVRYVIYIYIYI